jgi:hypothetical protein
MYRAGEVEAGPGVLLRLPALATHAGGIGVVLVEVELSRGDRVPGDDQTAPRSAGQAAVAHPAQRAALPTQAFGHQIEKILRQARCRF